MTTPRNMHTLAERARIARNRQEQRREERAAAIAARAAAASQAPADGTSGPSDTAAAS